jgi:HAD superfamily hydrolase (TIGR01509 family)
VLIHAAGQRVGVVFDCDGVLADTNQCWDAAFGAVAGQLGLELSRERLALLRGAALGTAAGELARWSDRGPRAADVLRALERALAGAIDTAELTLADEVRELLDQLRGVVRVGVASNSPRSVLLRVLARLDITEYFAAAVSADDVPRPKPAPDPYLAACRALGIDPPASFAIEDSAIGVSSAAAAGLTVIELTGARESDTARPPSGSALQVRSLADPRIGPLVLASAASAAGDSQ